MTNLDVNNSSTDSSSGSSSDSSSSGSSSSGSGSSSSSSDSESSASDAAAPAPPATAPAAPPPRAASPVKQNGIDAPATNHKKKDDKTKEHRRPSATINKISSSSDDETPKPTPAKTAAPQRRRSSAKTKTAASVAAKHSKSGSSSKPPPESKTKPAPKTATKQNKTDNSMKKKSIFSPDNSTESESEDQKKKPTNNVSTKPTPPPTRGKGRPRKPSKESKEKPTPTKKEEPPVKENIKRRSASTSNGPPSKKPADKKESASSCTSSQSSADSDTADSGTESESPKKTPEVKTGKTKPPSAAKNNIKSESSSKTSNHNETILNNMPRKLTRSLSARVSRLATVSRPTHTDTESEADDKHNDNHKSNEVMNNKRGRRAKGREAKGREAKSSPLAFPPLVTPAPTERCCPVRGCDSQGHLGGRSDSHFTWDACPLYHNVTSAWCVAAREERAAAAAARRAALAQVQARPRAQPTIDQRAYQLKVKDMRSKWKGSQELRDKLAASGSSPEENRDEREPILEGFVPEYDLRLFREAQALAAVQIEEQLQDIPTDRGTRYVVMGKFMMEVWYQSPYPGDAARVPRLFVCEYCLNHHKSATGAKRHAAKCVWRHPPGDEVYRKSNLSVWQVDGRAHRQYCQQLCLLAKFFLDHKTLYNDVEPFLFYVMTVADNEGCHVVGYFSKEKNSFQNYNVSCILTLPPYQRQGYGRLLIDFSYLLTKVEGKVGSPETPLSDLGLISYRSYWKEALLKRLCSAPGPTLCIRDLSKDLAIASCDIVSTLQERGLMKYWKGKHIVLKKQEVLEEVSRRAERARCVDAASLRWSPPAAAPPR